MKLVKVSDIFYIEYGNSLELNRLTLDPDGVNFISRTSKNNGVSAKVKKIEGISPTPANTITVALGGSVLSTFLQPEAFYSGYHISCLFPKFTMSEEEKLFYCSCLETNKYRFNYGRQANRTLKDLLIPARDDIPDWVNKTDVHKFDDASQALLKGLPVQLETKKWQWFEYRELFEIERGRGPRKHELDDTGETPFVTSSDSNNGWTSVTNIQPIHNGNTIGVNRNGSVAEAFYQPLPFCSTEDVHVFNPKFKMNQYIGLFLATLIKLEKYRYNYGRKWGIARMNSSKIKLPVDKTGKPDYIFMENYIKSLPFSKQI